MGHDRGQASLWTPPTVGLPWEVWPAWARAAALQAAPGQTRSNNCWVSKPYVYLKAQGPIYSAPEI